MRISHFHLLILKQSSSAHIFISDDAIDVTNMAPGVHREESVFTSSLRPYRFSPLYLSHETRRAGEETTEEHAERDKNGFFRVSAAKMWAENAFERERD